MRVDWARLNHILIPDRLASRDRRRSASGRVVGFLWRFHQRASLEGRAIGATAAFMTVFALEVRRADVYLLWGLLGALVFASLLWSSAFPLRDVVVQVLAPRRVAVGEEVTFSVVIEHRGAGVVEALRVWGPFLPWHGRWLQSRNAVPLLAPQTTERTVLRARFRKRGEHGLEAVRVARLVPLGLALGPSIAAEPCRFLVVPRVTPIARFDVSRARRYQNGGIALASRRGDSQEVRGLRPYRPGDRPRDLHAKSWARSGQPVVREYLDEYFSRIGIVLDTSGRDDVLEEALSLAGGIVAFVEGGDALLDVMIAGDRSARITVGRSLGSLDQALDFLACVEPTTTFDPHALGAQLEGQGARLSSVVFVALAWDEPRRAFARELEARGMAVRTLWVGAPSDATPEESMTPVSLAALRVGAPLVLP